MINDQSPVTNEQFPLTRILKQSLMIMVTLILAASCGDKRPPGILSEEEMVQVMEELYISEEKINQLALSRDSAKQIAAVMDRRVFRDAGLTDSIFRKSFDYYMERPQQMERIYTALVDTLQLREQRTPYAPDMQ